MTKQVKYTEEQAQKLYEQYLEGSTVKELAASYGRSVQSVTAKLVRMGVYKKAVKPQDTARVTKLDLAAQIEGRYAVEPGTFADMEKLTKATLLQLAREY